MKVKEGLSLDRIIKINEWANHHLHRGLRPYPWQMDWAIAEVQKLFYRGFTSVAGSLSSFAAFETENIEELRQEFTNTLIVEYPGANIEWQPKSEIVDLRAAKGFKAGIVAHNKLHNADGKVKG